MNLFKIDQLKELYTPHPKSSGEDNGQVTIIGGSKLFHGAPLLALKAASRVVDMVFFASSEKSVGQVAEQMKSKLMSFIWVPWDEVEHYIEKSDSVLIGPGFMRYGKENSPAESRIDVCDETCIQSREITRSLLTKFPDKKWVIDAGSLQTMDSEWIPPNAIITPNMKEFEMLFGKDINTIPQQIRNSQVTRSARDDNAGIKSLSVLLKVEFVAKRYNCIIVQKGPETIVCSPEECVVVKGGNAGMTKGGTGDVLAGLTAALLAKNDPFLAAASASYIEKAAADELYKKVGTNYNADDLADKIPEVLNNLLV